MKKETLLVVVATVLVTIGALNSCSTDNDILPAATTRTAVLFTGDIGDAIGIFMLAHGTPDIAPDTDANRQFITTTGTAAFSPAPGNDLYYPLDGSAVDFVAYYPYHPDATLTGTLDVSTADQSRQADFDLLWASADHHGIGYNKSTTTAVPLAFAHRLSRLTLHCQADAANTALPDLDGMVVTIRGMYTSATFSLWDGTIGTTTKRADFIANNATPDTAPDAPATFDAIVLPATYAAGDVSVDFSVHGDTYTWHMDAATFASGCDYTYRVLLTMSGVEVSNVTISPWGLQETVDGDAVLDDTKKVGTLAELKEALATVPAGVGSADAPAATIRLTADITTDDDALLIGEGSTAIRHIRIDGGGHTLKHGAVNTEAVILAVDPNSSLTLTNITLDGDGRANGALLLAVTNTTVILDDGAILTNTANVPHATAAYIDEGLLRLKPGSAITNILTPVEGNGAAIWADANSTISFEGGTLSGNSTDVVMIYRHDTDPLLKVQAWPKIKNGGGREALTIKHHYTTYDPADVYATPILIAEGVAPLTPALASADFSLVSVFGYIENPAVPPALDAFEFYKAPDGNQIYLRKK